MGGGTDPKIGNIHVCLVCGYTIGGDLPERCPICNLLSDFWPHGEVAKSYGVLNGEKGFAKRAVFVVDKEGLSRFSKVYPVKEVPDVGEILEAVRKVEGR